LNIFVEKMPPPRNALLRQYTRPWPGLNGGPALTVKKVLRVPHL
jgi:hypothetical protein